LRPDQNAAHAVGVSERERAGRVRIVSGLRRQMTDAVEKGPVIVGSIGKL
jgi:hypothetical protein